MCSFVRVSLRILPVFSQIVDVAGSQLSMPHLVTSYLRGVHAALLVFSLDDFLSVRVRPPLLSHAHTAWTEVSCHSHSHERDKEKKTKNHHSAITHHHLPSDTCACACVFFLSTAASWIGCQRMVSHHSKGSSGETWTLWIPGTLLFVGQQSL